MKVIDASGIYLRLTLLVSLEPIKLRRTLMARDGRKRLSHDLFLFDSKRKKRNSKSRTARRFSGKQVTLPERRKKTLQAMTSAPKFARQTPVAHPQWRLYCLPYAGGSAAVFSGWGERLKPEIEVWMAQPSGLSTAPDGTKLCALHRM